MTKYVALFLLCAAALTFVPWYRRRRLCAHSLLDQILPGRFADLQAYLQEPEETTSPEEFWQRSRGLRGIISRFRDMTVIARLLQHQVRAGVVDPADETYIWQQAAFQIWFSICAIPEALACAIWRGLPHPCGLFALRAHYQLTLRTVTVCGRTNAPEGMELLRLLK